MAKREAEGGVKQSRISSKLMQMKFMQRGPLAKKVQDSAAEQPKPPEPEFPAARDSPAGCTVIFEADPLPAAAVGVFSFQNFNPAVERMQEEAQRLADNEREPDGESISDAEMAHVLTPTHSRAAAKSPSGSRGDSRMDPEANAASRQVHKKRRKDA